MLHAVSLFLILLLELLLMAELNLQNNVYVLNRVRELDVTCFIISLFTAQHVSNISTSIFRSLRLIVDLFHV